LTKFVTADNHFDHFNIIRYESRPYSSTEEMNLDMIEKWNSVVSPEDEVYNLGDIALAKTEFIVWLSYQLVGKIYLVKGNHDKKSNTFYQSLGWTVFNKPIVWHDRKVVLSHARKPVDPGWINIHGHSHSKGVNDKSHYCVSVENTNYTPINLNDLIKEMKK
jgi:calcineurin-like phosphoesterase family protein